MFSVTIQPEQTGNLMVIYGLGASSIFIVLTLMYAYAGRLGETLELTPLEKFETNNSVLYNLASAVIPLISVFLALVLPERLGFTLSGFAYFLFPPVMVAIGITRGRQKKKLFPPT